METIPCPECGAQTNGYCPNCQTVTANIHQWRGTPSVVRELQSLALGLAVLCEAPTTKVSDVIRELKEVRLCENCGAPHTQDSRYCSKDCSLAVTNKKHD